MTETNPNDETERSIEAEPSGDDGVETPDSDDDGSAVEAALPRRGALALLAALGLGSAATGNASAASGDHLGELWDGSPGTGRGLETVLREKGQALKGTAGTNTNDSNDIGVKGTTYSTRGIGLEGLAAASSGNTVGLKGRTDSPDGTALFGIARNTSTGSSLAVEGLSRADDGTAMQGYAKGSGDTVGLEGRVDSSTGYGLATPDDARIEGVVDTNETDFIVDAGTQSTGDARNVVAGHASNETRNGAVGTTISGGGFDDDSTVNPNVIFGNYGTVGGGTANQAGSDDNDSTTAPFSTVGGGRANTASASAATVGGGTLNRGTGDYSTVGGGLENSAGEYSTVGGGTGNTADATWSTIGGGESNTASANAATVGGGSGNTASGYRSAVAGGASNTASGEHATVGGGQYNDVRAQFATIAGGGPSSSSDKNTTNNVVYDKYGTIGGGGNNQAGSDDGDTETATYATVGGGTWNTANANEATVGGGNGNTASDQGSTVGGGTWNTASAEEATVGGGHGNTANANEATVGGGIINLASGKGSTVGGGDDNTASGSAATVPGGTGNTANGKYSFAAGSDTTADHDGTFVWSDSDTSGVSSTAVNQFLVAAQGGVGIGTNDPATQLHVSAYRNGAASLDNHIAVLENTSSDGEADVLALKMGEAAPLESWNNYVTFKDGNDAGVGSIEGDGSGGINYTSGSADYAEYMPRRDPDEEIEPAEIVGVVGDAVTKRTADSEQALVVSEQPIVTGNSPGPDPEDRESHDICAFTGQVPVKVTGPVAAGDLVVPSGDHDGTGRAISPENYRPGDGPLVGRAWARDESEGVTEVTVAVGIETGEALAPTLARQQEAIEGQQETIETLEDELQAKDERIDDLEQRLTALETQVGTGAAPADD